MRIADRSRAEGGRERIALVPESADDLWHLANVLEPGDLVAGDTSRRIQRDDDRLRDTGGEREHLRVTVEVESVEFARFANRLRVGGEIVACSREDQVGLHHTLNVEERAEVTVEKVWKPDQLDRLQEAVAASAAPDVAVATVEEGTAHVHTVAQYGVEERAALSGTTGKGEFAGDRTALFTELGDVLARLDVDAIVLAGPGFTKRDALDVITDAHPDLAEKVTLVDAAAVGDRGVHEVLKRGAVDEIQEETRIAREAELVDDLLERIADGTKAAYGPGAVAEAAEYGAVEHLLVVDDRLRAERAGEGDWDVDVDTIVETVEQQGGDVTVLSGEFDPGERVATLGGIAALLRYRLE